MPDEAPFRELVDFIQNAMRRWSVPGVAVGVYFQGRQWTAGLGVTSVGRLGGRLFR